MESRSDSCLDWLLWFLYHFWNYLVYVGCGRIEIYILYVFFFSNIYLRFNFPYPEVRVIPEQLHGKKAILCQACAGATSRGTTNATDPCMFHRKSNNSQAHLYRKCASGKKQTSWGSEGEQAPFQDAVNSKVSPMCNKILEVCLKTEFIVFFLILMWHGLGIISL